MRHHHSHVLAGPHARSCRSTTQVARRFGDESEEEVGHVRAQPAGSDCDRPGLERKTYEPTVWVMAVWVMAVRVLAGQLEQAL